jgi:ketosteroid isomerase-like protein
MKLDAAQTVTLFLAKMGDRDLDGALALCAEDIVFENPAMDPPANVANVTRAFSSGWWRCPGPSGTLYPKATSS